MNGWRNRATWLVNLWFEPECTGDVDYLEENLQHEFEKRINTEPWAGFIKDLIDFTAIDWDELRNALPEDRLDNEDYYEEEE